MSSKFQDPEPKLPDMYTLWLRMAQVAHKLEPFARGDRSPAAVNAAREALAPLGEARHELVDTEVFISETLRALDAQHERAVVVWEKEVDRPDLDPPTRINAAALVGHAQAVFNSPNCYNCGHPKNAHGGGQDPDVGPGCAVVVEHGYPCDCPQFVQGQARPVAEIHGRPAGYHEFSDVLDEMDAESEGVATETGVCAQCGHYQDLHPPQGGQCAHTDQTDTEGEFIHCLCMQFQPTYRVGGYPQ